MNWRILLFIPAILLGFLAFYVLQPDGDETAQPDQTQGSVPVQAFVPVKRPVEISIEGFGRVEPVRTWEGVSQVDGRIIMVVDDLAEGTVIRQGMEILRIDPRSYEISRDRAAASLQTAQAQLAELDAQVTGIEGQLALERRIEEVIQADVNRRTQLVGSGTAAPSSIDQAQRDLISQQRRILDLENQLALIPVQRVSAEANLRTRQVELEEAERNLANTTVIAPFTGRVLEEDAAVGEYVRPGDRLVTLVGLDAVEVVAEVQPSEVGTALELLRPDLETAFAAIDFNDRDAMRQVLHSIRLTPVVRRSQGAGPSFPARIVRIDGTADEATGTVGLVVRIDQGGLSGIASRRPLFTNGAFVTVEFKATTPDPWLTVPRDAIRHEGSSAFIYVADETDRLARRKVSAARRVSGQTIVEAALEDGDRVITVPPEPAISGQALSVVLQGGSATE